MVKVLPLYDKNDTFLDYAIIDDFDFERAEQYKWRRERSARKDGTYRDYAYARINKIRVRLHHFVMGKAEKDEDVIDHINRDGLDDRRQNLRTATGRQNAQNAKKPFGTGYIGVSQRHDSWYAYSSGLYLGRYQTAKDAAIAHDKAAVKMYGENALTNEMQAEQYQYHRLPERSGRQLPMGVTIDRRSKSKPYVAQANSKFIGNFATQSEAHEAYIQAKLKDTQIKNEDIKNLSITRDEQGRAIIKLSSSRGNKVNYAIVDDADWHDLKMHTWYQTGNYIAACIDGTSIKMHRLS